MIDNETLGNAADAIVISVGAVVFCKDGILGSKEWFLDPKAQLERRVDFPVLRWWLKSNPTALLTMLDRSMKDDVSPEVFEKQLWALLADATSAHHFPPRDEHLRAWSNGSDFDLPQIKSMIQRVPWRFWNQRCYRSVSKIFGLAKNNASDKHSALVDAEFQATQLIELFRDHPEVDC